MQQVKKYAYRFEIICWTLIPIIFISPFLIWFFGDNLLNSSYGPDIAHFGLKQRALMSLLGTTQSLFIIYGLLTCISIARLFQLSQVFTLATASLFARLRTIALCYGLYSFVLQILVFHYIMPTIPSHVIAMLLSTSALVYFFVFVFLSILAFLVLKAATLQKEQDLTV